MQILSVYSRSEQISQRLYSWIFYILEVPFTYSGRVFLLRNFHCSQVSLLFLDKHACASTPTTIWGTSLFVL